MAHLTPPTSFRRFLNRCRAAVTAFKHADDQPRYLVVYERTGFEDDCGGNPSFSSRGHTAEGAAALFVDTTLRWTREAGGDCERARVVMVVGEIDLSRCQECSPGVSADA